MTRLLRRLVDATVRNSTLRGWIFPLMERHPQLARALRGTLRTLRRSSTAFEGVAAPHVPLRLRALTEPQRRLLLQLETSAASTRRARHGRPRLAFVSPLPPLRTGIAFHAAELVLLLADLCEIELVTPQSAIDDPLLAAFPLRSPDWLKSHGGDFDHIVYQFGNSAMHEYMFDLLQAWPGVVALHDLYLSNMIEAMEQRPGHAFAFPRALYASHGWAAIGLLARQGRAAAVWAFPASREAIDTATGVIVHSHHARKLVAKWWGSDLAERCEVVPLLRTQAKSAPSRAAAREMLELADDDFLVASFGLLGETKLNIELIEAFDASPLAADPRCHLVFVGENVPNAYGAQVAERIRRSPAFERIHITGFVAPNEYALYLAGCDLAVQLRARSRGETSAAVLDGLAHGIPVIANAHGSTGDLPAHVLLKVSDPVDRTELAQALSTLRADSSRRNRLGREACAYVQAVHAPEAVARAYERVLTRAETATPSAMHRDEILRLQTMPPGTDRDAEAVRMARSLVERQGPRSPRRLFVDVSAIVLEDLRTGIQRVVRSIVGEWLSSPPDGWRVEPVYSPGALQAYRYARKWTAAQLELPGLQLEDAPVDFAPGDVFLGLDHHARLTADNASLLQAMRERGTRIHMVIYDLLPVRMPEAFPPGVPTHFQDWLQTIATTADGVVCISDAVAIDFRCWLAEHNLSAQTPSVHSFPLGADLPVEGISSASAVAERSTALAGRPMVLMVGTIEPRKGHRQALAGAEWLWNRGGDFDLVVVGKAGWMTDGIVEAIRSHPENGRRLIWRGQVGDDELRALYGRCDGLLAASHAEGFGLPIIEAARHRKPVLARDIPVFREVGGTAVDYFQGETPEALGEALRIWLCRLAAGTNARIDALRHSTWNESAHALARIILPAGNGETASESPASGAS